MILTNFKVCLERNAITFTEILTHTVMKKVLVVVIGALTFGVTSCGGSGEKKIISVEKKITYTKLKPVHADRKLAIEVRGMSCEHACGGAIRMALKETGAVDRVSYDFEDGRKTQTAFITFDKSKINVDKIVSIIESINDKQFTTGKSSSTDLTETTTVEGSSTTVSSHQKETVSMETPKMEMPNIYKIFANLFQ